ncbi:succinate dehydrogenase assembly factor 1, mitochondrial-like [Canis lupus baileyi]|uniref:succinate dehydrogenase assembly factor 1, mitochondrial-like n=1 Tax=Canis lupus baileyi TaxID=143281 RepID=UPI003B972C74
MSRASRLQRQVLSLYRRLGAKARAQAAFRQHASLPRSDVLHIEYLCRHGWRQLQLLRSGHTKAMGAFVRRQGPTKESSSAGASGAQPEDGGGPRNPFDSMGSPETPPDGR